MIAQSFPAVYKIFAVCRAWLGNLLAAADRFFAVFRYTPVSRGFETSGNRAPSPYLRYSAAILTKNG
jgi:hypothetical protein